MTEPEVMLYTGTLHPQEELVHYVCRPPLKNKHKTAQVNAVHSVVALKSKLDFKFHWEGNEETKCTCLLHS